jgi:hypothetical protein
MSVDALFGERQRSRLAFADEIGIDLNPSLATLALA